MARYIQKGKIVDFTNTTDSDILYRDVLVLTSRIGVAECNIPKGGSGSVGLDGVYEMPAETSVAFSVGQKLFWDTDNKCLTATAGEIEAGIAVEPKDSAASSGLVKL